MSEQYSNDPILDFFIFETTQHLELLESLILHSEKENMLTPDSINEIFRIMHTIKGSSAMMRFSEISEVAHSIEDLFFFLRENSTHDINFSALSDLVLAGVDFVKVETEKIKKGIKPDGEARGVIQSIREFLDELKAYSLSAANEIELNSQKVQQDFKEQNASLSGGDSYKAVIYFEDDCDMENIRAFAIVHKLKEIADVTYFLPEDVVENEDSAMVIRELGFQVFFNSELSFEKINEFLEQTVFLKELQLVKIDNEHEFKEQSCGQSFMPDNPSPELPKLMSIEDRGLVRQSIISVSVEKLDKLMNLVGELTIAEAMVTQNPDLNGLELDNFHKAARQLQKISNELQDTVMSIRMVPLANTFNKMQRVTRDMSKKLSKDVQLKIIGEETEVDKNIIEHIADPLMHLVRNAIDHGIEPDTERRDLGKVLPSTVTLEARNSGSDVLIVVKDDGKGLNKEKILERAREHGLLPQLDKNLSDKEIFNLIFLPGFSTKDGVTEFSGRGVGLDVVRKNVEDIGGALVLDSKPNEGTIFTLKIPLTLAIIDGMNIKVGNSNYTLPTSCIKESFRPKETDIFCDPDGNEMIMVRGQCYPVIRLHKLYDIKTQVTRFSDGILIMVEHQKKFICLFVDELLGQQQVVIKALPTYITNLKRVNGLAGCTLLGDGSISLILDIGGLYKNIYKERECD